MEKEILATGFVRPKTTSLFFDKIWLPQNMKHTYWGEIMGYSDIPDSLIFTDKGIKEFYSIDEVFHANTDYMSFDTIEFLFSGSRNSLMLKIVKAFKKIYNIDVVPIFFDKTRFEKMILTQKNFKLKEHEKKLFCDGVELILDNEEKNQVRKKVNHIRKTKSNDMNAIEVCIKYVPEIVEDKLEWKQIEEMKKDKQSIQSLRRFWNWFDIDLKDMASDEIREVLEIKLEDYRFSLKKHGVLTVIGGFSTVLSSASSLLSVLSSGKIEIMSACLAVSAGILTFSSSQVAELFQCRREPIAYIYKISKMPN